MDNFTRAAQSLSDATRLRILNILMLKECCVCEVMQALNISQTRASRNLKILNDAGFLNMRNDGLYTLYSLKDDVDLDFHIDLLKAVQKTLSNNTLAQKDIFRLQRAKRLSPKCIPPQLESNLE
jgi:ArsR family transcriptional regulator